MEKIEITFGGADLFFLNDVVPKETLLDIAANYTVRTNIQKRINEKGINLCEVISNPYGAYFATCNNIVIMPDENSWLRLSRPNRVMNGYEFHSYNEINQEIRDVINLIYDKTGIEVPGSIIDIIENEHLKRHVNLDVHYCWNGLAIHPRVFNVIDKEGECDRRNRINKLIIYGMAHWVYSDYFSINPKYDEMGKSYTKECFSVAFQQYVMDLIPETSEEYKQMERLIADFTREDYFADVNSAIMSEIRADWELELKKAKKT